MSPSSAPNIWIDDRFLPEAAAKLQHVLNYPRLSQATSQHPYQPKIDTLLGWQTSDDLQPKLSLFPAQSGAVCIDFLTGKKAHRRQFGGGMGQPLVRAMGRIESRLPTVFDATAGMGADAFVLASLGFEVWMNERSPLIAALIADGLARAQHADELDADSQAIFRRMRLSQGDSALQMQTLNPAPETIYLDPMYPEKKKRAATKKEMAVLQQLIGPDLDSSRLLDAALNTAQYRVVVKRPKGAEPIAHPIQPSATIDSPNTRYDLYAIKALQEHIQKLKRPLTQV
ncbi:MAG: class I SAM-dependent methyltransferase [Thiotrichales bacterium]|nr:class I SAM-dependent methyltransferase [Thiotrichales bacterium]